MLATNVDERFKRSLTYLEKTINSFDDSLEKIGMNIDQFKSEESERMEDDHENAIQLSNEKWKSFWDKQFQNTRRGDTDIKEIKENNHSKYYMPIYCKDFKRYLSFLSLWPNICKGFSDKL